MLGIGFQTGGVVKRGKTYFSGEEENPVGYGREGEGSSSKRHAEKWKEKVAILKNGTREGAGGVVFVNGWWENESMEVWLLQGKHYELEGRIWGNFQVGGSQSRRVAPCNEESPGGDQDSEKKKGTIGGAQTENARAKSNSWSKPQIRTRKKTPIGGGRKLPLRN